MKPNDIVELPGGIRALVQRVWKANHGGAIVDHVEIFRPGYSVEGGSYGTWAVPQGIRLIGHLSVGRSYGATKAKPSDGKRYCTCHARFIGSTGSIVRVDVLIRDKGETKDRYSKEEIARRAIWMLTQKTTPTPL